jgi:hypothetical protein
MIAGTNGFASRYVKTSDRFPESGMTGLQPKNGLWGLAKNEDTEVS